MRLKERHVSGQVGERRKRRGRGAVGKKLKLSSGTVGNEIREKPRGDGRSEMGFGGARERRGNGGFGEWEKPIVEEGAQKPIPTAMTRRETL